MSVCVCVPCRQYVPLLASLTCTAPAPLSQPTTPQRCHVHCCYATATKQLSSSHQSVHCNGPHCGGTCVSPPPTPPHQSVPVNSVERVTVGSKRAMTPSGWRPLCNGDSSVASTVVYLFDAAPKYWVVVGW